MPEIHPLSDVQSNHVGKNTKIWQYVVILNGAIIGENCNISCHTFIEGEVAIGNNVTIKSGVYLWDGITIKDDVFIGPNVVFTNDIRPRSKQYGDIVMTKICKGASLGANSTILAGITIGQYAMTGIGSVVTRDVPNHALVYGNPAKVQGWVDESGHKLEQVNDKYWKNSDGILYKMNAMGLTKIESL